MPCHSPFAALFTQFKRQRGFSHSLNGSGTCSLTECRDSLSQPEYLGPPGDVLCCDVQALILASAFQETAKLAKRIQELEVMDAQLEGYRQMLRAAIAFQRRRRVPRNRLDSIPEICAEPEEAADEDRTDS